MELFFFIIIIIIFIITKRNSPNFLRNLLLGISIFLVIVSPMLYDRSQQFDDPFYIAYSQYVFSGTFEKMISIEEKNTTSTASDYIEANGILPFLKSFFLDGIYNIISTLWRISFPYLFILIPFGIIFSFRAFDQDRNSITANWIFIILSLASLTITFSLISEKRYLYYLFPFLIIFCVIPVQRVTTYGLNTFSFSEKQKSIFLIIIMLIALVLATSFTLRYDQIDDSLEIEKYEFSKYILNNLDGNSLREFGGSLDYLKLVYVENSPEKFKNCEVEFNKKLCGYDKSEGYVQRITITGNSIEEILDKGQTYDLKYIFVNKERNDFHGFIDDIYFKEDDYPYLEKIFDSDTHGFQNLKVKVFEINYDEYWNFKKINN